jgi:hypothetical protein
MQLDGKMGILDFLFGKKKQKQPQYGDNNSQVRKPPENKGPGAGGGQGGEDVVRDDSMPDNSGVFLCNLCGERFDTMEALTEHKEEDHE